MGDSGQIYVLVFATFFWLVCVYVCVFGKVVSVVRDTQLLGEENWRYLC